MKLSRKIFITLSTASLVFLVGLGQTSMVLADSPTQTTTPGVQSPTGAAAGTYTYDSTTGLWENAYYTWSPTTGYVPVTPVVYTYDPNTGLWDYSEWVYDAATVQYNSMSFTIGQPPVGADTVGGPNANPSVSVDPDTSSDSGGSGAGDPSIDVDGTTNVNSDNNTSATVNNGVNSNSNSGDATVSSNTTAGDAITGDSAAMANILNEIQSSTGLNGLQASTFTANINGDVNGNLVINPGALQQATTEDSAFTTNVNNTDNNDAAINNNVNLNADTGNADVSDNTTGGNATSGNADAVANVVNMINSMISANQSFLGVVNIYGNLNGDILMPAQFLNSLIATNAPTTTVSTNQVNNLSNLVNNNESVNNNVKTTANTGQASVTGNTTAGNATTGNASTNVTIFNLTGSQIVGQNALLVFVNVMGTWVGLLMNAPAGTTAAAYGGNITQNVTNNVNSVTNNNEAINNNINENCNTGDASVTDNTSAGNATSGNAECGANLLNLENSQFNLSNWFGVLFINVFGNWYGNFGEANPATSSDLAIANGGGNTGGKTVFGFLPTGAQNIYNQVSNATNSNSGTNDISLISSITKNKAALAKAAATVDTNASHDRLVDEIFAGAVFLVGIAIVFIERIVSSKKAKKTS